MQEIMILKLHKPSLYFSALWLTNNLFSETNAARGYQPPQTNISWFLCVFFMYKTNVPFNNIPFAIIDFNRTVFEKQLRKDDGKM